MKTPGFEAVLLLSARSEKDILDALNAGVNRIRSEEPYRLALMNPTPERVERAKKIIAKGKAVHGLQDIWYSPYGMLKDGGKLAFMYPGIDSLGKPEVQSVADAFSLPHRESSGTSTLEDRGADVFHISDLYTRVLQKIGVKPDLMFGHSLGEWSCIVASGLTASDTVDSVLESLGPGMLPVPGVVFAALGCGVEKAKEAIQNLPRIEVSHDNCPHQSIICGDEASVDAAIAILSIKKIMAQKLDFRSGFHTSLFKDFVGPIQKNFDAMVFVEPKVPVWSATTCAPYPSDEKALRKLIIQHLVEGVRFRELTEVLYEQGVRVFVQVGAGSLPGFINDTLRGRPHLAVSSAAPQRSGPLTLQKSLLSLFVEGAEFDFSVLEPKPKVEKLLSKEEMKAPLHVGPDTLVLPLPTKEVGFDLNLEMEALFADIKAATQDVLRAMKVVEPFSKTYWKTLTLKDRPELMDHCFYKQKRGWKNISDLFPVMPMTATIDMIVRLAEELFPDRVISALENISATKWLSVEEPKTIEIQVVFDGRSRLKVDIVGHYAMTVVLATSYAVSPSSTLVAIENAGPSRFNPKTVYDDGYLFHGPRYQCIEDFLKVGDNGITGTIKATTIPGALLDNVGQIAGIWIMQALTEDRYAMPIRIKRMSFYGPQPKSGLVVCDVRTDRIRSRDIMFQMELSHEGQIWARIEGWEKWRFECDQVLWNFILGPGRGMLSEERNGYSIFEREYFNDTIADEISKRYLREAERKVYATLGRKRQSWISGRIAAKDAVRRYLWSQGYQGEIFPAEIWIENDELGKPLLREAPGSEYLNITISHKPGAAVAMAGPKTLGIDIERVEQRDERIADAFLSQDEKSLLPNENRDEWLTRFWGAKEALAKSTGRGLEGNPRAFKVEAIVGEGLIVNGQHVASERIGDYIISQREG